MSILSQIFNRKQSVKKEHRYDNKSLLNSISLPVVVFNNNKKVLFFNEEFGNVFNDISKFDEEEKLFRDKNNDKVFNFVYKKRDYKAFKNENTYIIYDLKTEKDLAKEISETKIAIIFVEVDNYDELISKTPDDEKSKLSTIIETKIRDFAKENKGSIIRYKIDRYIILMPFNEINKLAKEKFPILEKMRNTDSNTDIPVSISIGIGVSSKNIVSSFTLAEEGLELARGRGSNQAILKIDRRTEYFGGESQYIGTRNKGKSRIIAHLINKKISESSNVVIQMHKNPDIDSISSAIAVSKITGAIRKDAFILLEGFQDDKQELFNKIKKNNICEFYNQKEVDRIFNDNTLVIIVDTNIKSLLETTKYIKNFENVIVIDHHIKKDRGTLKASISFIEPQASSTAELITELLENTKEIKNINKDIVNLLYAGIIIDTNRFSVKTGRRTFEAAAYLKENGANISEIQNLLQVNLDEYLEKANIVSNIKIIRNGIAIVKSKLNDVSILDIAPKAADEILEIKNIKASIVVSEVEDTVYVNSRSLGEVNVMRIMEKLGGGGHFNVAAAQVKGKTASEVYEEIISIINKGETEK